AAGKAGPLIDKARIKLGEIGSRADLVYRGAGAVHAADPDKRHIRSYQLPRPCQHDGGSLEKGTSRQAARFLGVRARHAGPRQRGVGYYDPVYLPGGAFLRDIGEVVIMEVGRDLQEDGKRRALRIGPRRYDAVQQFDQAVARLQVAQADRVRRGDVDRDIGGQFGETPHAGLVIGYAVGAGLVGADIDADDAAPLPPFGQPPHRGCVTLRVEAEAVDDGLM